MFVQKLDKILKNGGKGSASIIYPNLLPILSHLPDSILMNSTQFYNNFFANLQNGLKQKSVICSRSESAAVATTLMECLQYTILKSESMQLCKQLIKNHIISTIEWCLKEEQASYKIIYNQTAATIQSWAKKTETSFENCLEFFFDNLIDLFDETINNLNQNFDVNNVASKQVEFLLSLKHIMKPKKQFNVTFASSEEKTKDENIVEEIEIIQTWQQDYFQRINVVVYKICDHYVKYINANKSKELIEHLYSMVLEFNTEEFFENMRSMNGANSLIDIFDNLLYVWLKSDDLRTKPVVDLVFLLFKYVDVNGKNKILQHLKEVLQKLPSFIRYYCSMLIF